MKANEARGHDREKQTPQAAVSREWTEQDLPRLSGRPLPAYRMSG
jgi:hypothetical protein